MADNSAIEWTDATWNPTVGCSVLTPGCTNCYAMRMAARLEAMGQPIYAGMTKPSKAGAVWTGKVELSNWGQVIKPLSWKKPRRIFVNSMSDLFHENVPDEAIDKVFAVMALTPQHTYQVLTKRAERMRDYFTRTRDLIAGPCMEIIEAARALRPDDLYCMKTWPLPNVWLGVSCERQQEADERIPHLLQTPAAIRFVSAEPLLGPINFGCRYCGSPDALHSGTCLASSDADQPCRFLDWIIVGGESGPRAREFDLQWARSIIAQCRSADVECFVKQLGARVVGPHDNGVNATTLTFKHSKGGDWSEWPDDLRIRQFPNPRPSSPNSNPNCSIGRERVVP